MNLTFGFILMMKFDFSFDFRPNEITLGDFKSVFDRQGTFRFYFKTEDPDIGVVKEQITADDQILPNWKGKILVWVSEIRGK